MLLLMSVACSNFTSIRFGTHVPFPHCATLIQSNCLIFLLQLYINLFDEQMLLFTLKSILGHIWDTCPESLLGTFGDQELLLFCFTLAVNLDSPFCRANKLPAGFGTLVSQINF